MCNGDSEKRPMKKQVYLKVHEGVQKCTFELLQEVVDKEGFQYGRTETLTLKITCKTKQNRTVKVWICQLLESFNRALNPIFIMVFT